MQRAQGADGRAPKVLVIDDEAVMREGCAEILAAEGYEVETAASGSEGLDVARTFEPDVAVVDLLMPGTRGMEVIRALTAEHPTIVVVVITGHATVERAVESIKSGAFDVLPKPFTPGELRRTVGKGIERKKLLVERQTLRASVRLSELTELVGDWLTLARFDEEGSSRRLGEVDLEALARDTLARLSPRLAERGMTATMFAETPLPAVRGGATTLLQVLDGLLGNAIEHGRPGGRVELRLASDGPGVRLEVEDDGAGIAAEQLPFLFDEFCRTRSDESPDSPEAGSGLAIVRKLVAPGAGTVEVRSELGAGSCLTIRLPGPDRRIMTDRSEGHQERK